MNKLGLIALTFGAALVVTVVAASPEAKQLPPAATKTGVTYAADIKPIFDKTCIKCHGATKKKAGLRLDSREAAIKGAKDGPVFEPGKSGASPLVKRIARLGDEDDWMPPVDKAPPLSKEQVALIRAWIDQGAK